MTETFFRWHRADAPDFNADNAWSGLWGGTFSADGSQSECLTCDGTGQYADAECEECDGEGWQDCARGYSSCWTAEDLRAYMATHLGEISDDEGRVIVFEGNHVGDGFDGEPLAIPARIIEEITWTELTGRV